MMVIGTEVLAVDSLSALHRAIVRIGFPRSRGSFVTLKFGEKKAVRSSLCLDSGATAVALLS
jgi:hypothetical protein